MKVGIKQLLLLFIEKYTEIMVVDLNLLGLVGDLYSQYACFGKITSSSFIFMVFVYRTLKVCVTDIVINIMSQEI